MKKVYTCVLLSLAAASSAFAAAYKAAEPLAFEVGTPTPAPSGQAPVVTFEKFDVMEIVDSHSQSFPAGSGTMAIYECTINDKAAITVSVKNWKMSPGGNGITFVVDNVAGKTVFDVSKPVLLSELIPPPNKPGAYGVNGMCGWHFIAAMATLPSGESVKTPQAMAVAPFLLGKGFGTSSPVPQLVEEKIGLIVLNPRPLGKQITNHGHVEFLPADPAKVVVDYQTWPAPQSIYQYHIGGGQSTGGDAKPEGPMYVLHVPESKTATEFFVNVNTFANNWSFNQVQIRLNNPQK